jgi:tight adherence protein B
MLTLLIAMTVFLFLSGLFFAVIGGGTSGRRAALARIERSMSSGAGLDDEAISILRETESDLSSLLSDAAERFPALRSLELLLYRAGRPMTLSRFLGLSGGLAAAAGLLGAMVGLTPVPALLGLVPWMVVRRLKNRRMKAFDQQFPQALALFSRALRAGHSMTAALQMVGSELPDPVGPEFALVSKEIALGLSPATAMANLQDRLDASDLPVFVTAVLVQLETGGNLAEILDSLAGVIRERILFDGKVRALTAQSAMSAKILVAVPFAIVGIMHVLNPTYVAPLLETEVGHVMLGVGLAMVSVGYLICRRISQVSV